MSTPQRPEIDTALTETSPRTPDQARRRPSTISAMLRRRSPPPMSESLINSIKNGPKPGTLTSSKTEPNLLFEHHDQVPEANFVRRTGLNWNFFLASFFATFSQTSRLFLQQMALLGLLCLPPYAAAVKRAHEELHQTGTFEGRTLY